MSRYDGLIIPRSYSEYINKTDAATLQQALQLSGVLSGAVAAEDNKAVKSSAVATALANTLANYQKHLVDVTGQEITMPSGATLMIYCHHPYSNTHDYFGFALNYNNAITVFTIANTNGDLPFTTAGAKITFKGGWWKVKITELSSVF